MWNGEPPLERVARSVTGEGVTSKLINEKEPDRLRGRVRWEESSMQGTPLHPMSVSRGRKRLLLSREEGRNWRKGWREQDFKEWSPGDEGS